MRRSGPLSSLDLRRSLRENLRRHARGGRPAPGPWQEEDLRFRHPVPDPDRRTAAAVIAIRDVSASMGEAKKYLARALTFWLVRFLRARHDDVELCFVTHHTEARVVGEHDFFHLAESGGTRVSAAYRLALELVDARFPPQEWNSYVFHFSDGENWGESDSAQCRELVAQLLARCNLVGYCEVGEGTGQSTLWRALAAVEHPRLRMVRVRTRSDAFPALRHLFAPRAGEGGG